MDCGFRGWGFKSLYSPVIPFCSFNGWWNRCEWIRCVQIASLRPLVNNDLLTYWNRVELIWQENLLIDFLQKKILDIWLKKFVTVSANIFNERLLFDVIYRIYIVVILDNLRFFKYEEHDSIASILQLFFFSIVSFLMMLLLWHVIC